MSQDFPEFEECAGCNSPKQLPKIEMFEVPSCPDSVDDDPSTSCDPKPKFFSRLTRDFTLPAPGQVVKMYVCDADLFTECGEWVAVCNKQDKTGKSIASLRILSARGKVLTVYNGCSSTNPVVDNPEVGTTFSSGTPIFPTPPRWCSAQFKQYMSDAINASDGQVCAAIKKCLSNSTEICFSSIPDLIESDSSELSLLGGFIKESAKKCLRFLDKIITGSSGQTLCFTSVPSTDDTPETDGEGNKVPKHLAYFLKDGCIMKGAAVGQSCADSLNFDPTNQKINKIWVCAQVGDSVIQKLVVPTQIGQALVAYQDGSIYRWRLRGVSWNWTGNPEILIYDGAPSGLAAALANNFGMPNVPASAIELLIFTRILAQSATGDNIDWALAANGIFIMSGGLNAGNSDSFQAPDSEQSVIPGNGTVGINFTSSSASPSGGTRRIQVWVTAQAWK